jgi:hypothetical protein
VIGRLGPVAAVSSVPPSLAAGAAACATWLALYTWRLEPHWLELELIEVNARGAHIVSASAAEGSPEQILNDQHTQQPRFLYT